MTTKYKLLLLKPLVIPQRGVTVPADTPLGTNELAFAAWLVRAGKAMPNDGATAEAVELFDLMRAVARRADSARVESADSRPDV